MDVIVLAAAAGAAAGALSAANVYNQSTILLNSLGWSAAGDYRQLGASYGLASFPAVYGAAWFMGHPRPLELAGIASGLVAVAGWQKLDPKIMAALGNKGYGIEGGSGGAVDANFSLYRAATVAIMVGGSTAIADALV